LFDDGDVPRRCEDNNVATTLTASGLESKNRLPSTIEPDLRETLYDLASGVGLGQRQQVCDLVRGGVL
jgi:hypothetical protein